MAVEQQEASGHPTCVITVASQAYKLAKQLGRRWEAAVKIRVAFIKTHGNLGGECFYSIWLEWVISPREA